MNSYHAPAFESKVCNKAPICNVLIETRLYFLVDEENKMTCRVKLMTNTTLRYLSHPVHYFVNHVIN